MDEEIDPATWRRYLYRVRQYARHHHPYFAVTCREDAARAEGVACIPCFEASIDWGTRHGQELTIGPAALAAHVA